MFFPQLGTEVFDSLCIAFLMVALGVTLWAHELIPVCWWWHSISLSEASLPVKSLCLPCLWYNCLMSLSLSLSLCLSIFMYLSPVSIGHHITQLYKNSRRPEKTVVLLFWFLFEFLGKSLHQQKSPKQKSCFDSHFLIFFYSSFVWLWSTFLDSYFFCD